MTINNLDEAANGEDYEIEELYPHFVREREKHHRAMFKEAFSVFKAVKG